jgi:hypothetical protein
VSARNNASIRVICAAITLPFAAIAGISTAFIAQRALAAELVRVTTSFDVKYASAVLRLVARLPTGGFPKGELERISHEIDSLRADQPRAWQLTVHYQGQPQPLEIHALLDDLGMIDLDFATTPALAPAVRKAVDGYLNGRGH